MVEYHPILRASSCLQLIRVVSQESDERIYLHSRLHLLRAYGTGSSYLPALLYSSQKNLAASGFFSKYYSTCTIANRSHEQRLQGKTFR